MANQTGTATSQEDLITQLFTFATANGFTQSELDLTNNRGTLNRTTGGAQLFVHFAWDGSDADNIAMAQSLAFSGPSVNIDAHTNDSGNGTEAASLADERRVSGIGNGPFTGYHFFADTTPSPYCYVILQYASGLYRHFGFGIIDKIGDWTGGEFVCGHVWNDGGALDDPDSTRHTLMMDAVHTSQSGNDERAPGTLHAEGLVDQPGSPGRWLNVGTGFGGGSGWNGTDGDAEDRGICVGGFRGGYWTNMFGRVNPSLLNGFIPLIPIPLVYENRTPAPDTHTLLGFMPNVRHVQMANFTPGQSVVVGSDTWVILPGVRKSDVGGGTEESKNMGIAYLQTA